MTNEQKRQVRDALTRYANNFDTQTEAAATLVGVSASTISQVKNNNWELLSERLWHNIARQVGFFTSEWQPADTSAYLLLRILMSDAQHYAMTYGIAIGKGLGKTFTAHHYTRENAGTIYIACHADMNRRTFMTGMMEQLGIATRGTVPQMTEALTNYVLGQDEVMLVFDDADLLKDRVLHLLVLLINSWAGKAGTLVMGGEALRNRILEGVRLKRVGYDEIYKSIGRRFITLTTLAMRDVELVCRANGLHDGDVIAYITGECGNDLHRAVQLIQQNEPMKLAA